MDTAPLAIWWIKRDARLRDNAALLAAVASGCSVLPLFCFEPSVLQADDSSLMHQHAQLQAISTLRRQLRQLGAELLVATGELIPVLQQLHRRFRVHGLYSHQEIGNAITYSRDRQVKRWCEGQGIGYWEFPQSSVRRGGVNRDRFQRLWQSRIVESSVLPAPTPLRQPDVVRSFAAKSCFPELILPRTVGLWQEVTEVAAQRTLAEFLNRRSRWYRGGISSPNTAVSAGSRLSVHLAWGTLSVRQVWHATQQRLAELAASDDPQADRWRASLQGFLSRLHWRDHFTQRLESEPELEFQSIHPSYREVPFENSPALLEDWQEGRTGFPLVDAVMRCLAATGFVNFRMRAMVVSFACHALHLDWRVIHPHLASVFRDYDPGIHLSQLQMQAGVVGWNPVRVYNPAKQLADWDSGCVFVKRWLPELRDTEPEAILHHQETPVAGYPAPVIDFAQRTEEMKGYLYHIRGTAAAKAATPAVYARHGSRKKPTNPPRKPRQHPNQRSLFD